MVLAHIERDAAQQTKKASGPARRHPAARPTAAPLPGPGVFATGDSIGTPALLPDGSIARESISAIIDATPIEDRRSCPRPMRTH